MMSKAAGYSDSERTLTFNPADIERNVEVATGSECVECEVLRGVSVDLETQQVTTDGPGDRVCRVTADTRASRLSS